MVLEVDSLRETLVTTVVGAREQFLASMDQSVAYEMRRLAK